RPRSRQHDRLHRHRLRSVIAPDTVPDSPGRGVTPCAEQTTAPGNTGGPRVDPRALPRANVDRTATDIPAWKPYVEQAVETARAMVRALEERKATEERG